MDGKEFELAWHRIIFQRECLKRMGMEFQTFFEAIMGKAESSFVTIKPWGNVGDKKCDGIVNDAGLYFQVYAPEGTVPAATTVAKIDEDFSGAKDNWPELREWVFVWSAVDAGLPPEVEKRLQELRAENKELAIDDWGEEALWTIVKEKLTPEQRVHLLGVVPRPDDANRTTAAEIQTLLNWIVEQPIGPDAEEGFDLTDLAHKLSKNQLSERIGSIAARSLSIAIEVKRYVSGSVDVKLSSKVASRLIAEYELLSASGLRGDALFAGLIEYVEGDLPRTPELFWAAAGIVTYYFQICDIFER
jgi:hypothetical protein